MKASQIHRRLSLPTGTETLHLQEVARQRRISRLLSDLFEAWGYRPVETPIVDYYEVYRRLLDGQDMRQIYRAVDRQGEILALRSDTTMFLAKQLGLHLSPEELPVRVYYDEQIVRAEERNDISRNEYQQTGVELVGVSGTDGDAEVLVLAREALTALGIDTAVLHVGSHRVVESIMASLPDDDYDRRRAAIGNRDFADDSLSLLSSEAREILTFIGTVDEFTPVVERTVATLSSETVAAIEDLTATVRTVGTICDDLRDDELRIDLSELGSHGYYTGLAFSAYIERGNAAVVRGGRYDHLLEAFGFNVPSVGFSMFSRKLPFDTLEEKHAPYPPHPGESIASRRAAGKQRINHQADDETVRHTAGTATRTTKGPRK